jgi:pyruvate dehydrogenase E2 component (dihydrolipoamide acetyltransferase)
MEFKLPEIGEGVQEGELIKWLVKEGDSVNADQPILEVMTDKATVEVPAPQGGVITGLTAKEGQMIKVGQVLAQISGSASPAKAVSAPPVQSAPAPVTHLTAAAGPTAPLKPSSVSAPAFTNGNGAYRAPQDNLSATSVPAAPIVRAMAHKAGVDLSQVNASGPSVGGVARVLEEDLLRFLETQSSPAKSSSAPTTPSRSAGAFEEVERKPLRGLRRVIAQAMVKSKYTAPHYSYVDEFECSQLVSLREEAKRIGEKMGVKITYLPFIVKALVGALKEFPIVNSSLEETPNGLEVVYKKFFHIGFAVATPEGLIVPVIKNADKKSLIEIAKEMNELSDKVRAGKATSEELKGSTFSITSMGNIGGLFATPIINYPEVGIMGVYKVQEKPIVKNSQIVVGKTMHLSLSLDHRVVDGAVGGHFCNAVISRLQEPARLLMELV